MFIKTTCTHARSHACTHAHTHTHTHTHNTHTHTHTMCKIRRSNLPMVHTANAGGSDLQKTCVNMASRFAF